MKNIFKAVAAVALALPMMASAATLNLANKHYVMTGTLKIKGTGACYGMKFKARGKADPVLLPISAEIQMGSTANVGDLFTWKQDSLLPGKSLVGAIFTIKGSKYTFDYNLPEQDQLANALLTFAGNGQFFQTLINNAHTASFTQVATFSQGGAKVTIKEVATVTSYEGPCTGQATVTRQLSGFGT